MTSWKYGIRFYFTVLIVWLFVLYDKNRMWANNFTDYDEIETGTTKIRVAFKLARDFEREYRKAVQEEINQ